MRGRDDRLKVLVLLACVAVAGSARGQQSLVDVDFDTPSNPPNPAYTYAYHYAGGGNPQTDHSPLASSAVSAVGNGNGGGNAMTLTADYTSVPLMQDYNYKGLGGGLGVFRFNFDTNTPQGVPSGNLADYRFTADLAGSGFTGEGVVEVQVQFQVRDDRFTPDGDGNMDPFAQINYRVPVSPTYSTVSFTLDQGTLVFDQNRVPAEEQSFLNHAGDIGLINPNFNFEANFGQDADNRLMVDNVKLTLVPEPASAGLLVAGLCLSLTRRPRRVSMPRGGDVAPRAV